MLRSDVRNLANGGKYGRRCADGALLIAETDILSVGRNYVRECSQREMGANIAISNGVERKGESSAVCE